MKDEKQLPQGYKNNDYQKSNFLIGAKYKSTILENKITAIASYKLSHSDFHMENSQPTVTISDAELRKALKNTSGSFYKTLDETARKMQEGMIIGYSNPETGDFDYMALLTRVTHENSELRIKFHPDLNDYLLNLQKNYTVLNLESMLKYKSTYAFRLDELLRASAYFPKGVTGSRIFRTDYGLTELKLKLGVIDANDEHNKKLLKEYGDSDVIEGKVKQQFAAWGSFRENVLKKATKEINDLSPDMTVYYDLIYGGKGGAVKRIVFTVDMESKKNKANNLVNRDELMEHIRETLAGNEKLASRFMTSAQINEVCDLIGWDKQIFDDINSCVATNADTVRDTYSYYIKLAKKYPNIAFVREDEGTEDEIIEAEDFEVKEPVKPEKPKPKKLTVAEKEKLYDEISELIEEKITFTSIKDIAAKADFNLDTIKKAYEYTKGREYKDFVPYLKNTIEARYWEKEEIKAAPKKQGVTRSAAEYNARYEQRDYSVEEMKEIEKKLLTEKKKKKADD